MKKLMNSIICLLLFMIIGTKSFSQEATVMTLEEAVTYALKNSLSMKNAMINIADADAQIKERKATGMPQVGASADYQYFFQVPVTKLPASNFNPMAPEGELAELRFGFNNNFTAGINANMLVFDGSYLVALEAARAYKDHVQVELKQTQFEITNAVTEAYLPTLIIEETKTTLNKNISNLEKLFFETKEMYKAGFVEQLDVDRLELSISNLRSEVDNLDRQSNLAYNALKFQMGYPITDELKAKDDIESLFVPATEEELEAEYDVSKRPELRVLESAKILNQLNVKAYKRNLPSVAAYASYQQQMQGDNIFKDVFWIPTALIGLQANYTIFDGFSRKAKEERAILELDKINNQQNILKGAIMLEVENARINYRSAFDRLENQKKNLALAEKIYNTSQIKYREGVGSSLEIMQAEQSLFETQQNQIQALFDLLIAKAALMKALG